MLGLGLNFGSSQSGSSAARMGGSVSLLLDTYGSAAVAYSLRKLNSSYDGKVLQVRRASDHVEVDVGFDSNGLLSLDSPVTNVTEESTGITQGSSTNAAKLGEFCGEARRSGGDTSYATVDSMTEAAHVEVVTWYDQSENTRNAIQAAAASQPRVYDRSSGLIVDANGKPTVQFGIHQSSWFDAPTVGLSVATCFIHHTNFDANARMFGQFDRFENSFLYDKVTGYRAFNAPGSITLSGLPSTTSKLVYAVFDNTGGELGINGATATSGTLGVLAGNMDLRIGRRNSGYWYGTASELIAYPTNESDKRTGIETNINTFYSIY